MSTYGPGGVGHRILAHLRQREATMGEIRQREVVSIGTKRSRKLWYAVMAMVEDGFVRKSGQLYFLTETGEEAVCDLNANFEVVTPGQGPRARRAA